MREPPAKVAGCGGGRLRSDEARETPLHLGDDHLVIDRAGGRDHHVGRAVVAREIAAQAARVERAHRLRRAEDRAADRLVRERHLLQVLEDQVVGRVLGRADLLHDDVLLARELFRLEGRIGEDVGQHVERERHVGAQHARIVGGAFDAGRGVEVAADRLDLLGDLPRGAPRRALERHVLEQMRDAVLVGVLVAAAGADPHAERGALQMRHGVGDDHQAGRQPCYVHAHAATPCAARLAAVMNFSTAA